MCVRAYKPGGREEMREKAWTDVYKINIWFQALIQFMVTLWSYTNYELESGGNGREVDDPDTEMIFPADISVSSH